MRVCQKGVKSEFGPISYGKTALTGSTTLQVKKTTYNSVTLRWNKVPGAKKYEIFCMDSMGKEWKSLGIKGGTSFTHKKLVTGATYYYQIRPVRDCILNDNPWRYFQAESKSNGCRQDEAYLEKGKRRNAVCYSAGREHRWSL